MRDPSAGGRPILPRHVLKDDPDVLRVKVMSRQAGHGFANDLLFDTNAGTHTKKHLNQNEIIVPPSGNIRECRMESEVISFEFNQSIESILLIEATRNQTCLQRLKNPRLELAAFWFTKGYGNDGHGAAYFSSNQRKDHRSPSNVTSPVNRSRRRRLRKTILHPGWY